MTDGRADGLRSRGARSFPGALVFFVIASVSFAIPATTYACLDRVSLAAISMAAGGATVACSDGAVAIFLNPAGLVSIGGIQSYADYAEPSSVAGAREARLAVGGNAGFAVCGLGWYRLDGPLGSDDYVSVGAARTILAGTQGSYIAVGGAAVAGRTTGVATESNDGWSPASADLGIVVRPLPAISLAYAVGNIFDRDTGSSGWGRAERWGVSYFWENSIVLSFARCTEDGETKSRFGVNARAGLPVEISFGLSEGDATGGIRWIGSRLQAGVSLASEGADGVTWSVFFEGIIFAPRESDWR